MGPVKIAYQSPLTVAWASSDLRTFTPASAPILEISLTAITTSHDAATTTHQRTTNSPLTSAEDHSSLSTGAKAGIGVAASIVGLCFFAAAAWFMFKRRTRQSQETQATSRLYIDSKTELSGDSANQPPAQKELIPAPVEVEANDRQELEDNPHAHDRRTASALGT